MRRPMVVANWKMYTRPSDAYILATTLRNMVAPIEGVEVVVCPPLVYLSEISDILKKDGKVNVGAQNMYYEPEGPYTGEVSPLMIRDMAKYVIVGHSERRAHFAENNIVVNEKVLAALKYGLVPIICVGEQSKNSPVKDILGQLEEALDDVPKNQYQNIVVAYEPVWAIGTGNAATLDHVVKITTALREIVGLRTTILYGGSVDEKEALKFSKHHQVDGLLVGTASLRASVFINIVKTWANAKSFKGDVQAEEIE